MNLFIGLVVFFVVSFVIWSKFKQAEKLELEQKAARLELESSKQNERKLLAEKSELEKTAAKLLENSITDLMIQNYLTHNPQRFTPELLNTAASELETIPESIQNKILSKMKIDESGHEWVVVKNEEEVKVLIGGFGQQTAKAQRIYKFCKKCSIEHVDFLGLPKHILFAPITEAKRGYFLNGERVSETICKLN